MNSNALPATLLIAKRDDIEAAMGRYLMGSASDDPSVEDIEAARRLVDLLISSFRGPQESGDLLAAMSVSRSYYSRFGDGITPVLKDVIGDAADSAFLSQSIDGYWRAVRAIAN